MFDKIVNPNTGRKVNIYSNTGKAVLQNYINVLKNQNGGSKCPSEGLEPIECLGTTKSERHKEYLQQSKIYHPDKNGSCVISATKKFTRLGHICNEKTYEAKRRAEETKWRAKEAKRREYNKVKRAAEAEARREAEEARREAEDDAKWEAEHEAKRKADIIVLKRFMNTLPPTAQP